MPDAIGLPELRDVLGRLSDSAQLGYSPEQIAAAANALYHGRYNEPGAEGYDPRFDPNQWVALANARDWMADPAYLAHLAPENIFGKTPEELRSIMHAGWSGPGWSKREREALGRDPEPFELSPGDYQYHQWDRDRQYLDDVLTRRTANMPPEENPSITAWTGPSSETPETIAERNLKDALYWYNRSNGARYSSGQPGVGWGTANYRRYATDDAMFAAPSNPDYGFGWLATRLFAPLEDAVNHQTMRNTYERDEGYTPVVTPVWDFFANALRSDTPSGFDYASSRMAGANLNKHSPVLPTGDYDPPTAERIRLLQDARAAFDKSQNMSGDDYHFSRTGKNPTFLGSMGTTLLSGLFDPSILVSGFLGGFKKGKALASIANELGQESVENAAINTGAFVMPKGEGLNAPHPSQWYDQSARSDIPLESASDRHARIQREQAERDAATRKLQKYIQATPGSKVGSSPGSYGAMDY